MLQVRLGVGLAFSGMRVVWRSSPAKTASLLHNRLLSYTGISFLIMLVGFVIGLVHGAPLMGLRVAVLSVLLLCQLILRRFPKLTLKQLRWLEGASVCAILTQVSLMSWLRIEGSAMAGEISSSVIASQLMFTLFCLIILAYGIFIPNSWKRQRW